MLPRTTRTPRNARLRLLPRTTRTPRNARLRVLPRTPRTPRNARLRLPEGPPGRYSVRLTVDGKTFTQPLIVGQDPRGTL